MGNDKKLCMPLRETSDAFR